MWNPNRFLSHTGLALAALALGPMGMAHSATPAPPAAGSTAIPTAQAEPGDANRPSDSSAGDLQTQLDELKAHPRETPVTRIYQAVSPAVVYIQTRAESRLRSPVGNWSRIQNGGGSGTGVVIMEEGFVVTNYHVVRDADLNSIQVSFRDDPTPYRAELLSYRELEDLALLRIVGTMRAIAPIPNLPASQSGRLKPEGKPGQRRTTFPTVRMGTSADLMPGERVIAIGNPHGQTHTVSEGIISGLHRNIEVQIGNRKIPFQNVIQTDASINLGNSGGPLLNVHGEMIGINSVMNVQAENIGFAIPVDKVRDVLEQELFPDTQLAYLGFELGEGEDFQVSQVWPGSPAAQAGICVGDRIHRIAGKDLEDIASLIDANRLIRPFKNTEILVEQGGGKRIAKQLSPWERIEGDLYETIGLTTKSVPTQRGSMLVVDRVLEQSPAFDLGLQKGDLLYAAKFTLPGRGTRSLMFGDRKDLWRLGRALPKGGDIYMEIYRDLNEDGDFTRDERHKGVLTLP